MKIGWAERGVAVAEEYPPVGEDEHSSSAAVMFVVISGRLLSYPLALTFAMVFKAMGQ